MGRASKKKTNASEEIVAGNGGAEDLLNLCSSRVSQEPRSHRTRKIKYYLAGAASLLTFTVYLSSLRNSFVAWDDNIYVYENPFIRLFDIAFLKWAFFDFYASNWHPLTWISHALDYSLWGLNPLGHHLTSIILHAVNTFIVVLLVMRLLASSQAGKLTSSHHSAPSGKSGECPDFPHDVDYPPFTIHYSHLIVAGVTGLLFGLHPLHVESVAWVAERKDLLCALFFLLSIMMYLKYAANASQRAWGIGQTARQIGHGARGMEHRVFDTLRFALCSMRFRALLAALCFFILALMSKPMAVSLPVVLLILDWYPLNRIQSPGSLWSALVEKLPFIAASLVSAILTILAQKTEGAMAMMEVIPLSARLLVAAESLISYLWMIIWPLNLSPFYPYPRNVSILSLECGLSVVLVIGITLICITTARKNKLWLSVWSYYVVTLLPVLGIVQVGVQSMADRYTYLPILGPFLIGGIGVAWVSAKVHTIEKRSIVPMFIAAGVAISVFVSMSYLTLRQISIWENGIVLWSYVIEKEPEKVPVAYLNRGAVFYQTGQIDKAIADFDKTIALKPSALGVFVNPFYYQEAYYKRGFAFKALGRFDKAIADFDKATELNPSDYEAYNSKGIIYGMYGLPDKAIEQFNKAIAINPNSYVAYGNRGYVYTLIGQNSTALEDFNKAIELDQRYAKNYFNRGNLYLRTGDKEFAISDFRKACDLGSAEGCNALRGAGR